jgi:hypothetical protein
MVSMVTDKYLKLEQMHHEGGTHRLYELPKGYEISLIGLFGKNSVFIGGARWETMLTDPDGNNLISRFQTDEEASNYIETLGKELEDGPNKGNS